ncbi:hypothetical protein ACHAP8_009067 [Fusarium lateritium]
MQEPDINTVGARFPCLEWLVLAEAKDNDIASTILDPNGEGILFTEDFVKAFKVFLLSLRKLLRNLPRLKRLAVENTDNVPPCATIESSGVSPDREMRETASSNLMTHIMGFHRSVLEPTSPGGVIDANG